MTEAKKATFRLRNLTSVTTTGAFLLVAVSGLILMFAPAHGGGRRHFATWGIGIHEWAAFHTAATLLFTLLILVHAAFNARALWNYVRDKTDSGTRWLLGMRRELAIGLIATVAVAVVSFLRPPPLSWLVNEPPEARAGHGPRADGHRGERCAHREGRHEGRRRGGRGRRARLRGGAGRR